MIGALLDNYLLQSPVVSFHNLEHSGRGLLVQCDKMKYLMVQGIGFMGYDIFNCCPPQSHPS